MSRMIFRFAPVAAALFLGACAGDGTTLFQTASTTPALTDVAAAPRAPRVDPACVALANQIETLRKDGAVERLEKVAAGKGDTVQVKRASIAKQAELNKANADFQAKCAPRVPQQAAAPVAPVAAAAAAQPAVKSAAAKVVTKAAAPAGVTAVTTPTPTKTP